MSTKAVFIETVKAKMDALKADVDRLQANAKRIDKAAIGPYTAAIQEILAKIQRIEKGFTDGERLHTDTWQELKRRAEASFADIESLVKDAQKKYLP